MKKSASKILENNDFPGLLSRKIHWYPIWRKRAGKREVFGSGAGFILPVPNRGHGTNRGSKQREQAERSSRGSKQRKQTERTSRESKQRKNREKIGKKNQKRSFVIVICPVK
ncbi:MAG: hypothetical protein IJ429_01275 [Lachnospiraceae bacterium]|nr:hypothetical protein [Lachnospiraceae bacterium]